MNISQGVARVRDQVDDPAPIASRTYSDLEIVRHFDEQVRGMYRTMIFTNQEWSNMSVALKTADARLLFRGTYEWRLPTWIEKVVKVYVRQPTDAALEGTFSPYNWTSDANQIREEVPKTDTSRRTGWSWEGNHTFRMWNVAATPLDYLLYVAALPPPVFKLGLTVAHTAPSTTAFFLPTTLVANQDLGDLTFSEEGRYVNAEIEVTGTAGAADTKLGEVRRVIYSTPKTVQAGARLHELKLDAAMSSVFAIGDTVQTRIPIPEIHTRLLVLQVANACAIKKFNTELQKAIYPEMGVEKKAFAEYAQGPRDSTGPFFKTAGSRVGRAFNSPDRYSRGGFGWGW